MPHLHQLQPGEAVDLSALSTDGRDFCDDRKAAEKEFEKLRDELIDLQPRLYAESKQKLLIVLQALDAGGKDGTIRKVFCGVNPQGVRVAGFRGPSQEELSRDYLWRIHRDVPAAGQIGIFNRSHYGDVLVVRVDHLVPEPVWQQRYEQINNFEKLLYETGTRILKFYLHISKQEQKERLQARLDKPHKNFKFDAGDLAKRRQWDEYIAAYEAALTRCTTEWAPWYVIPADRKWYRNLAIARIIVETLRDMDPQFPRVEFDQHQIIID
jgi:PPK2 family polyphosphate:nucleotide phosphotransferase